MPTTKRQLNRTMSIFAAVSACVVAILPPAGYFFLTYRYLQGALETEAEISAGMVAGIVMEAPELWKYQTLRLEELLKRRPRKGYLQTRRIIDPSGAVIAESADDPQRPCISGSHVILDSGVPVAGIELRQSLRPVIVRSGLVALASALLAVLIYLVVKFLPMRAVTAAQRSLSENERKYRSLFTNMNEAALLLEFGPEPADAVICEANPACGRLFAADHRELPGSQAKHLFGSMDEELLTIFRRVAQDGNAVSLEREFPLLGKIFSMSVIAAESGRVAVMFSDITEHRAKELRIQQLTSFDSLTGLPNRALLMDRLKQAIAGSDRDERKIAVMLLDLDHFKAVTDTLGHEAGDRLLQAVAERLKRAVRKADTVARLGGDEFVIMVPNMRIELNAFRVARSVLAQLSEPFQIAGRDIFTSGSIGISIYPDDAPDAAGLLKNADMAMYAAKEQGRNRYNYYSQQLNQRAVERLEAETSLRLAISNNSLSLAYQPQFDARSGDVSGIEALLRWNNPNGSSHLPAARIITIAEETGLIVPIGEWVLDTACAQARHWRDAGIRVPRLAVNLSAKQFDLPGLVPMVRDTLERNGVAPNVLELELTESAIMRHPEEAARKLRELKELGVGLAVDDFGTGHSSLNYLKNFPIDRIKIDRSFVNEAPAGGDDAAIVEAVITLARSMDLQVIAEGVERRDQIEFLLSKGCEEMQGYYFARPMPAEQCGALLAAGRIMPV